MTMTHQVIPFTPQQERRKDTIAGLRAELEHERARAAREQARADSAVAALAAIAAAAGGDDGMPAVWETALRSASARRHQPVLLPGRRVAVLRAARAPANPAAEWRQVVAVLAKGRKSP